MPDEHDEPCCIDCGNTGNTVRDVWEFAEGEMLCCRCYSARRDGFANPQEYYIDAE